MLGLACCRASSSQLAKWLKVSRLHAKVADLLQTTKLKQSRSLIKSDAML